MLVIVILIHNYWVLDAYKHQVDKPSTPIKASSGMNGEPVLLSTCYIAKIGKIRTLVTLKFVHPHQLNNGTRKQIESGKLCKL